MFSEGFVPSSHPRNLRRGPPPFPPVLSRLAQSRTPPSRRLLLKPSRLPLLPSPRSPQLLFCIKPFPPLLQRAQLPFIFVLLLIHLALPPSTNYIDTRWPFIFIPSTTFKMSNLPSEPEFEQAYKGMSRKKKTHTIVSPRS